ncbi:type II secretion system F family protein [Sedimentibacter sp. zth1]|uniref:type II secretion system F family protein n=1 Tax=Sedimentibacter sp. zth1 TaxID=2816908 RepID=UPI001A93305D|nr:type II secretion system F family protein [Sedimentibacter sp. zth1]QSX04842.1 type II secretion system F family protein [Sedimentibacter sp. zth1]
MKIFVEVSIFQYAMLVLGTVLSIVWIIIYLKYNKKYNAALDALKKNEYFMSNIFFIGFGVMDIVKFNLESSIAVKKTKKICRIKGEKYAEFYYYVTVGAKITYVLTLLPISFFIGAVSKEFSLAFLAIVFIVLIVIYLDYEIESEVNRKKEELFGDFPNVLSKLVLLMNAGMTVRSSWTLISNGDEGLLFREMKRVNDDIDNGISEVQAYRNFGDRCNNKEIRKFTSLLIQNMQKGSSETVNLIKNMADESWQQKKSNVKIKGELASQKLMLPVGIMLIAILMIIIVPIFSSI